MKKLIIGTAQLGFNYGIANQNKKITEKQSMKFLEYCFKNSFTSFDTASDYASEKILVGPSESMSKSKKNTIDPEKMIQEYGADAVRLFILSDSPPEKDIQWSDSGMSAAYKFIQKFWLTSENISSLIKKDNSKETDENIDIFTNQAIEKINTALEKFRYNVIIAVFHDIYNFYKYYLKN